MGTAVLSTVPNTGFITYVGQVGIHIPLLYVRVLSWNFNVAYEYTSTLLVYHIGLYIFF